MNTLTIERPAVPDSLVEPVNELLVALAEASAPVAVDKLPKSATHAVLTAADRAGLIEWGKRERTEHGEPWQWRNKDTGEGKHTAETRTTDRKAYFAAQHTFSSLTGPKRKPLAETLKEHEEGPKEQRLVVRLTDDGQIRAASVM